MTLKVFLPQGMTLKPFLVVEREGIHLGEIRNQDWVDEGRR